MMSHAEYKVLKAMDAASKEQSNFRHATGQYNIRAETHARELVLGTNALKSRLPKYSEDKIYVEMLNLADRGFVMLHNPPDTPEEVHMFTTTAKGRVALAEYRWDRFCWIWVKFIVPVVLTAGFSAFFSCIFRLY